MGEAFRELEGTWEEIVAHAPTLAGRRVRLILLDETSESSIPRRPEPTQEQARLGIIPAVGNGTLEEVMRAACFNPPLTEEEYEAFDAAIRENRTLLRKTIAK